MKQQEKQEKAVPADRRIVMLAGYQGEASGQRFIPPGEYKESDPELLGIADYLLANGHAIEGENEK